MCASLPYSHNVESSRERDGSWLSHNDSAEEMYRDSDKEASRRK